MQIDKQNGSIAFNDQNHLYFNVEHPEYKYISVTTLIHQFTQPYDAQFWSAYKSLEKLLSKEDWTIVKKELLKSKKFDKTILDTYKVSENDFNREQQGILDEWAAKNRTACERGTKIHSELENSFYTSPKNISLQKYGIGGKFECRKDYTDLDLEYGVYPEYLISRESDDGILKLAGQIDLIIKSGNEIILADYKGLPLDTPILTSTGWSTMENLQVGDKVFDKDGNLCNVVVKSSIHNNPCYKINFSKHFSITADCDHRWLVYFKTHKNTKYRGINKEVVMTTKELYDHFQNLTPIQIKNGYNTPKIQLCKALNLDEKILPLDPYILGLWLGDGTAANGKITQELDAKSWDIIKAKGFKISHNQEYREEKHAETRNVYGLMHILKSMGLLNNKHIPNEYFTSSYNQRLNLLRGLMDADGYYDKTHKTYVMRTNYMWQAKGVLRLVNSLGVKATLTTVVGSSGYKENTASYDIKFKTSEFNAFMTRNLDIDLEEGKYKYWSIQSVELTKTVPTQCIMVDSPSHTYLCTDHLLVTHNTNKEIKTKGIYNSATKGTYNMQYPLNNLPDTNFWHYSMQLSTYAWMLQKINPDFVIKDLILIHFDHDGNQTIYHCDYLKKDVERMLTYYKKQLILEQQRAKRQRIEY